MKILIISDIHQRIPAVQAILTKQQDKVDHIIFTGDYFDNFPGTPDIYGIDETCEWLIDTSDKLGNKATWLCGNHDLQYYEEAYRVGYAKSMHQAGKHYVCSGYSSNKAKKIRHYFGPDKHQFFKLLQLTIAKEGFTFSHGGFSEFHFKPELSLNENIERWKQVWDDAITHISSPIINDIYYVGQCRGGRYGVGGPLWLDFKHEFKPIDDLPQIVGHTPSIYPQQKGNSYSFDCFNEYYGIVEDGYVNFYKINGELYEWS